VGPEAGLGALRELVAALGGAIEQAQGAPEGWVARGRVLLFLGDLDGALDDARRALALDPTLRAGRLLRAHALLARHGEALAQVDDEEYGIPDGSWGRLAALRGLLEGAVREAREAHPGALLALEAGADRDEQVRCVLVEAAAATFLELRSDRAKDLLERAFAAFRHEEYAVSLALMAESDDEARFWHVRAVELAPGYEVAWRLLGDFKARADRDLQGAIADYTEALALRPEDVVSRLNRAVRSAQLGRFPEALADLERALATRDSVVGRRVRAKVFAKAGDRLTALDDLDRALAYDPTDARTWHLRAHVLADAGDVPAALASYSLAITLEPRLALAWAQRGALRLRQGDAVGAAGDLAEALRVADREWSYRATISDLLTQARARAGARR
jgi:tetratricopeptide (TPR) repeat protein